MVDIKDSIKQYIAYVPLINTQGCWRKLESMISNALRSSSAVVATTGYIQLLQRAHTSFAVV